jgi:CRP/FNR family transcriptional regulator, dissimilatory nitrate respiration regulator
MERSELLALSGTTLFRGIDILELDSLLRNTRYSIRNFEKGEGVLLAGCAYDSLKIILEGAVSAEMQDLNGKTVRIETLKAPEPIASAILFAPEPILPVTVSAQIDTKIISLSREAVLDLCGKSRTFLLNYLRDTGAKLAVFSERFRLLQFSTLRKRIADWLIMQATKSRSLTVDLPYSKERLAEVFAVTRPSLSRELSFLVREGLIEMRGRTLKIKDEKALAKILSED